MRQLLRDFQPDVIHVHNIYHQLTPSIFRPMRQTGIPVVQTLHDYALISPNYSLFANGAICEDGKESSYWSLVRHRAIKGSVLASALDVAAYLFQGGAKPYLATVKQFISPSRFLARYVQGWIKQSVPITVLQNFTDQHHIEVPKQHRILYVGRLSHEKGVRVLLEAMKGIDVPLDIVGTGPEEASLRALAASLSLSNITWHGHQSQQTVQRLFAQSTVCVVPSTWYENNPLTILESFAQGTPVIGSDIGGIPELVTHDGTGAIVPPNDAGALHNILRDVQEHPERWNAMHDACRQAVSHNTPKQYIQEIEYIYEQALA
jgi:glycosyltransferase involved in cell wall biosynthesis